MVLVMPLDLVCQQLVGLLPVADRLHRKERGKPFLPKAELTLDFALRLGILGHQVGDAKAAEGALELGECVGVAGLARLVPEEAQAVGVKAVRKAVGEEDVSNMGEVGEGGFRLDEARADNETGGVVDGQGEDLELFPGPPLVGGAVVLEQIAIALALPSAAWLGAAFERFAQQLGQVLADMIANVGGGAFEVEAAVEFVGQEAEVGGLARGESEAQKGLRLIRPGGGVIASRRRQRKTAASGQPVGFQGIDA